MPRVTIRNRHQAAIDRLKAEGFLTAYDIAPHVGVCPATVKKKMGRPCRVAPNTGGAARLWSRERVREEFGWPDG